MRNFKRRIFLFICSVVISSAFLTDSVYAVSAELLPVEEGITLLDRTGAIYIHMESSGNIAVTVHKTEPEGIFKYYDRSLSDETGGAVYKMELSRCEYLVDSGNYASQYTVVFTAENDNDASFTQNIVVTDPDFEDTSGSEFHFYITIQSAESSSCQILSSTEYIDDNNVLVSEYYILLQYFSGETVLTGDVDADGKVNLADASLILSYYSNASAGLETNVDKERADVDSDGKVQLSDASYILMYYSKFAAGMSPTWDEIIG